MSKVYGKQKTNLVKVDKESVIKSSVVKKIIQIGNEKLKNVSIEIPKEEINSAENLALYQDLIDTCNSEKEDTAGLSAVQIGVLKRVFVVRRLDIDPEGNADPIWEVMINPTLKPAGLKESVIWEGCMSVGEGQSRLFGPVSRPDKVEVTYLKPTGESITEQFQGYMAHVVQHEQDHLNGVLFLKYVKNPANLWTSKKLDAYLDRYDHFPPSE